MYVTEPFHSLCFTFQVSHHCGLLQNHPCLLRHSPQLCWSCEKERSNSFWAYRNLFWQLSRDGNLHGSGVSHATSSSKPSFRALWRAGDALVGSRNAGWTTSKSRYPWPMPELHTKGFLQKRPEKDVYWIICHIPDNSIGQETELNW